ncbi:MAG: ATP-dependent Clp protease ATP-binding subunit [Acidobacteria bacterium]|nr:MAG: ATP-dependent Clp protease ATP-binding subunit [Acidobacteriota bacterium]
MSAIKLDTSRSEKAAALQAALEENVIGQKRAVDSLVRAHEIVLAGISDPHRPLLTVLFLGPTGVGKTELAKTLAKALGLTGLTRIDCAEFRERHTLLNLIGSPKSYVGYSDGPRLQQAKIDRYQTTDCKVNVVLFDEVEKAHPEFTNILLGLLDSGHLNLSDGETDFTKTIIILTSNLSSRETSALIHNSNIGFHSEHEDRKALDDEIWKVSKGAVAKFFRPELVNRIDKIISFHSLSSASMRQILALELKSIQERLFNAQHIVTIRCTSAAKDWLLQNGTSEVYGARELKRLLERKVVAPLASILANKAVEPGDRIVIDARNPDAKDLVFLRKKGQLLKRVKEAIKQQKPDFPLLVPEPLPTCDYSPYFDPEWSPT